MDFLIEQHRQLHELYRARESSADGRAAGAATVGIALATLTVTAAKSLGDEDAAELYVAFGAVVVTVVAALLARAVAGYRRTKHARLSTESEEAYEARMALSDYDADAANPDDVRKIALRLWRYRANDARNAAIAKEKWAAAASVFLIAALIFSFVLVVAVDWNR